MADIFSRHTGKSKKQVIEDIDRDNFMSADEAVKYGIVDEVVKLHDKKINGK